MNGPQCLVGPLQTIAVIIPHSVSPWELLSAEYTNTMVVVRSKDPAFNHEANINQNCVPKDYLQVLGCLFSEQFHGCFILNPIRKTNQPPHELGAKSVLFLRAPPPHVCDYGYLEDQSLFFVNAWPRIASWKYNHPSSRSNSGTWRSSETDTSHQRHTSFSSPDNVRHTSSSIYYSEKLLSPRTGVPLAENAFAYVLSLSPRTLFESLAWGLSVMIHTLGGESRSLAQ